MRQPSTAKLRSKAKKAASGNRGTVRVAARFPAGAINLVRRAAGLEGATVNQFLVQAAIRAAKEVFEEHEMIRLSREGSARFYELMTAEPPPVPPALKAVAESYKKRNVHHARPGEGC